MKTIITLDKANQAYGFPQLNGNAHYDDIISDSGITANTISATTYYNLPVSPDVGYYTTTGITISQTLTWDKTYWGISGNTNVDLVLPSVTGKDGYYLIIKDEAGICGNYRIRLTPTSGTIDGNNYVDMNINYMSLTCMVRDGNWYLI
jgi:hypothetical protein